MDWLLGFGVAVVLQMWKQYVPEAVTVILSMTTLRVVMPLVLTAILVALVHRMDVRWHPVRVTRA